jgi:hypothetical protein
MFNRFNRLFRWKTAVLSAAVLTVALATLGLLNNCAYQAATPVERAEIMSALEKYIADRGNVIGNPAGAEVTVRDDTAAVRYVITYPGGQVFAARQRARLVKKTGGWVVEDVEPKEYWK